VTLAARARRIAIAAAYGGGGLGLLSAATAGLLVAEAKLARRWIGEPTSDAPVADGRYGEEQSSDSIRFVLMGDSSAAGVGVDRPEDTPGAMIASGLAAAAERPVDLVVVARTGAMSIDLEQQVSQALDHEPHATVIMIGANDVTHRVRPSASVRLLDQAVRRLRTAGTVVVVGTCPDLGTVEPVAQPLRYVARHWSRQLAAAQTIAVVEAGGRTVSLGDLLGPEFAAAPKVMFGPDRFHPSAAGYRAAAMALFPSVCAALGYWPEGEQEEAPDLRRGEGVLTVAEAAAEAAEAAGTEVTATQVAGRDRGPRGRWALLRRRRRRTLPEVEPPVPALE
jgi:lysophospholipase L1-like esterase